MTTQQLIAGFLILCGLAVVGVVVWSGADPAAAAKGSSPTVLSATLPASLATDPLVPALAAQVPGDPFVQRMVGQRRGTSIPLPPPPPVVTPEPPLLPLIGH